MHSYNGRPTRLIMHNVFHTLFNEKSKPKAVMSRIKLSLPAILPVKVAKYLVSVNAEYAAQTGIVKETFKNLRTAITIPAMARNFHAHFQPKSNSRFLFVQCLNRNILVYVLILFLCFSETCPYNSSATGFHWSAIGLVFSASSCMLSG